MFQRLERRFPRSPVPLVLLLALAAAPGVSPALAASPAPTSGASESAAAGNWAGSLDVGGPKLRLALKVEAGSDGKLTAILDSLDQGTKVPVSSVTFEKGTLALEMKAIRATYKATLSADGTALEGTWSQGGHELPLVLRRVDKPVALVRPQTPEPPFPYMSRDVTVTSTPTGLRLAGTLVAPQGDGPFPAVLFLSGSGAEDRDETLMGHKPFLVLADDLARHGVASLRLDDRGVGGSQGDYMSSTLADRAADAESAIAFLAARPEVDRREIGLLGHSEGGLLAPRVALADARVRFLVLLAPPAEPLESLLLRQARAVLSARGTDPALIDRAVAAQRQDFALIRDLSIPRERLEDRLRERIASRRAEFSPAELAALGIDPAMSEQRIRVSSSPWLRSLLQEDDPAARLGKLTIPVLALFGSKDLQVDAGVNAPLARAALRAAAGPASKAASKVDVLDGLNHLFQHAETGAPDEYAAIEETFAPEALAKIDGWIASRATD